MQDRATVLTDDTTAFAPSPSSVPPVPVPVPVISSSLSPSLSPRKCEGCAAAHSGTYGSGRFCSATCAKKVGARHKWAARAAPGASRRPGPARRALADAPCESCSKPHDRSYGSGRFCSVHCARRVAATRKWEKSRSEKNKRLEAIRPAMLAPPPAPSSLAGKRRRVIGRGVETIHPSDQGQSFYVTGTAYTVPRPIEVSSPARTPLLATTPGASYLPPLPQTPLHYQQAPTAAAIDSSMVGPQVVYANHSLTSGSAQPNHSPLFYGQPAVPAYRVMHPAATSTVDTGAYSLMTQSPSPPPNVVSSQHQPMQYTPPTSLQGPMQENGMFQRSMVFDMEAMSAAASPTSFEGVQPAESMVLSLGKAGQPHLDGALDIAPRKSAAKGVVEGSETAARALLCLRATQS